MAELERFRMLIGGKAVDAASGKTFESQNPYTGEPWATVPDGGPEDVDAAVQAARSAFEGDWGATTGFARSALLRLLGDLVGEHAERLARLEVNDSGKLYREMIGQLTGLGGWFHYYAGLADKIEGRQIPAPNPNYLVYTRREPVGVVAAITPWNSPLLLMTWKLAPALAAGCTIVVKPSEHSPASTLGFAELVEQAGFPPGVINVVSGQSRDTGAALAAHPGVDKVAFTGSTATGRAVAHAAAENINKVTLELGGKSPQVVFADADLRAAANGLVAGVFAATGQTCMAGSRLIVHESVHDELIRLVAERAAQIRLGDPNDPETEMGPVANEPQYRKVLGYLDSARAEGATVAYGGAADDLGGYFVKPTVLTGVGPESTVVREEIFGPVLSAYTFTDEDEALKLANDTRTAWRARSGPRTCIARTGSPGSSARAPCGSTPTGRSRPACPSAGSARAGSAGRTGSTRSTSTPKTSRSGSSSPAAPVIPSPWGEGITGNHGTQCPWWSPPGW
jgi:acyl-CoA reductase-like NAD-dependent aldehyde dehydrogenase